MKKTSSTRRVVIVKLKFVFIAAMSMLLPSVLAAEDNFEKVLESYKNVTSESLLAKREKKQTAVILKEKLDNSFLDDTMVAVPGKNYSILKTEVTQEFYEAVMGENPSNFIGEKNLPVEKVSWYDAIVFCNKLSVMDGLAPVYSVSGKSDVSEWNYEPHKGNSISKGVKRNKYANGYRLPTVEEWQYAAKGGQEYEFSGSANLSDVGWWQSNSDEKTHPVAQKKPNGYGLYDMSGNVWEWSDGGSTCGGGFEILYRGDYDEHTSGCGVNCSITDHCDWDYSKSDIGFRIVRNIDE